MPRLTFSTSSLLLLLGGGGGLWEWAAPATTVQVRKSVQENSYDIRKGTHRI